MIDTLLTETDIADRLKVSLACLRRWRLEKRGPAFLKIGPLVRYRSEDLELWLASLPTGGLAAPRKEASSEKGGLPSSSRALP